MTKSQPSVLLLVEPNEAVTNSVEKETHRPPSYIQPTGFRQGSQLKRGKHNCGLCFPSALQLAHPAQLEGHQLSPGRHSSRGHQNPSAVAREGLGRKEESRQLRASPQKVFQFPDNVVLFTDFSLYRLFHISIFIPEAFPVAV